MKLNWIGVGVECYMVGGILGLEGCYDLQSFKFWKVKYIRSYWCVGAWGLPSKLTHKINWMKLQDLHSQNLHGMGIFFANSTYVLPSPNLNWCDVVEIG